MAKINLKKKDYHCPLTSFDTVSEEGVKISS